MQLEFNFTDTTTECVACNGYTKTDEWYDYENKICIDCQNDYWEDYAQRKAYQRMGPHLNIYRPYKL